MKGIQYQSDNSIKLSWLDSKLLNGLVDPRSLFTIYRCDRQSNNPTGGVCILVHSSINSCPVVFDVSHFKSEEIAVCNICVDCSHFLLITCFTALNLSVSDFTVSIDCLKSLCNLSDSCLILGDFNLPLIDWINTYFPGDAKSQYFYLFFTDFGFYSVYS